MSFFDEVGRKAKNIVNNIGDKTSEIADVSKLKMDLSGVKRDIEKCYMKLGNIVYANKKNDAPNDTLVEEVIGELDVLSNKMKELEDKINVRQNFYVCSQCGLKNTRDAVYCIKCGNKVVNEVAKDESADKKVCMDCGNVVSLDAMFCNKCGKNLQDLKQD